ncbi:polyprenyl synthetase family protein [Streptomyces sp. NPDC055239]
MTLQPPVRALDFDRLKETVDQVLLDFLTSKSEEAADEAHLPDLAAPLKDFLAAGGKRIRPLLAMVGWHATGTHNDPRTAYHLAASLELFHAFALIHDDVIDQSDTRRGRPAIHRSQAAQHNKSAAAGRFGEGAAIFIGDLALIWSHELLHRGNPSTAQLARILPLLERMRTEVIQGQYLDLIAAVHQQSAVDAALAVTRYKTAKYTIERPLSLGAALAGADNDLSQTLSAFALPLSEAFQLREDHLGVFGDPKATGKSALDDLREGKATVLIALTLQRASRTQADQLRQLLGCPTLTDDQAGTARRIVVATGADRVVEDMIAERHKQALGHLERAPLEPEIADTLRRLADSAVRRLT